MFQGYMQPAQEKVSCPQISTVALPSLVPTGHSSPALSSLGRGTASLPLLLPSTVGTSWTLGQPQCPGCPTLVPSVRGSAGSLELIQHRITN